MPRESTKEGSKKQIEKQFVKGGKKKGRKQTVEEESSSNDIDTTVVLNDCADDESLEESSDDDLTTLAVGDNVVVKFAGKSKIYHYVRLLEKVFRG